MQAYTRLTAQRRFSFRTEHHELNTCCLIKCLAASSISGRAGVRLKLCMRKTTEQRCGLLCGVPRCSENVICRPTKLNSRRKPDLPNSATFAIQHPFDMAPSKGKPAGGFVQQSRWTPSCRVNDVEHHLHPRQVQRGQLHLSGTSKNQQT
jgi:hypothetical protein